MRNGLLQEGGGLNGPEIRTMDCRNATTQVTQRGVTFRGFVIDGSLETHLPVLPVSSSAVQHRHDFVLFQVPKKTKEKNNPKKMSQLR